MALLFAYIGFFGQQQVGAAHTVNSVFTPVTRAATASLGIAQYVSKTFVPTGLSCIYPFGGPHDPVIPTYAYWCIPVVLTFFVLAILIRKRVPAVSFGLMFFVATLLPVLQLIPFGAAYAADRYTYVPSIGISYAIVFGIVHLLSSKRAKAFVLGAGVIWLLALAVVTRQQSSVWANGMTLWDNAIAQYPRSAMARNNRGVVRTQAGDHKGALEDLLAAVNNSVAFSTAYSNLSISYAALGQIGRSIEAHHRAISIEPNSAKNHFNLGAVYRHEGRYEEALQCYNKALSFDPMMEGIYIERGDLFKEQANYEAAIRDYTKVIEMGCMDPAARNNRGTALAALGRHREAIADYDWVIPRQPQRFEFRVNRATSYLAVNDLDGAIADCTVAIAVDPRAAAVPYNIRASAHIKKGQIAEAIPCLDVALQLEPADPDSRASRAECYGKLGKYDEAKADIQQLKSWGFSIKPELLDLVTTSSTVAGAAVN